MSSANVFTTTAACAAVALGLLAYSSVGIASDGVAFDISPFLAEISGAVTRSIEPDVLYAIGDGGQGARPIVVRHELRTGSTRILQVPGAENYDWEAIVTDSQDRLWVLDVGDNFRRRPHLDFYLLDPDQMLPTLATTFPARMPVERRLRVLLPDGPRDFEAAIYRSSVGPDGALRERIYLFEKRYLLSGDVYEVNLSPRARVTIARILPVGALELPFPITDAAQDEFGRVYLNTYWGVTTCENCERLGKNAPEVLPARSASGLFGIEWLSLRGQVETVAVPRQGQLLRAAEDGRIWVRKSPTSEAPAVAVAP